MNKFIVLFFVVFISISLHSYDLSDDILVEKISEILIKEYDNYKDRSFIEKTILKLGKPAFIDSVKNWTKNYKNLDQMQLKLHPKIEDILNISNKYLTDDENREFRKNFEDLTLIAYYNLQIYYISLKEYLSYNNKSDFDINILDEALMNIRYFDEKKKLYEKEDKIKANIRNYFNNKKIKYKISFYAFVFDFFDKIRVRIVKKDMDKMLEKINERNG